MTFFRFISLNIAVSLQAFWHVAADSDDIVALLQADLHVNERSGRVSSESRQARAASSIESVSELAKNGSIAEEPKAMLLGPEDKLAQGLVQLFHQYRDANESLKEQDLVTFIHNSGGVVPGSRLIEQTAHSVKNPLSPKKPSKKGITVEGEEGELEEDGLAHYVIVPIGLGLLASLFLGSWLEKHHVSWFPESLLTIFVGMCLGVYMKSGLGSTEVFSEDTFSESIGTLLMLFLLPVLMFDAGWSLRKRDFASQFEYVLFFAVGGSLISFVVVGLAIVWTGSMGFHGIVSYRTAFGYASLVCATDPVATLATFGHLKVDSLLNILTFGDSVFNDAVAIILFKVLNSDAIMGTPGDSPPLLELSWKIIGGICQIFLGSVGIGLFVACAFLLLLRTFDMKDFPKVEILALVIVAYVAFAMGEVYEMSGIISTVFCSIILGIYARPHMSDAGLLLSNFFIKQLATIMDTLIFLLVGFCVVHLSTKDSSGWIFGLWVMLFCLVGRFVAVYPVSFFANFLKRKMGEAEGHAEEDWHLISPGIMYMMWHAGLRGAIALTLCMQFGEWADLLDGPNTRKVLQTATYFMIVVFLIVFGGTTELMLSYLEIPMGDQTSPDKLYKSELPGALHRTFQFIDERIMLPYFVGEDRKQDLIRAETKLDTELDAQDALQHVKSFKDYPVMKIT